MSNTPTCDLCLSPMFTKFDEPMYKVTVKRLSHAYDGYAPFVRKQKLDVCDACIRKLVHAAKSTQEPK